MTTQKMLSQEEIDTGLRETRAAIERARKALDGLRADPAKAGITAEKLQQHLDRMSPRARTWINSLVSSRMTEITSQRSAATKSGPRKTRSMV
jgi:hypothetical protein